MSTSTTTPDHARLRRQCRHLAEFCVAMSGENRTIHCGAYDEIDPVYLLPLIGRLRDSLNGLFARRLGIYREACEATGRAIT